MDSLPSSWKNLYDSILHSLNGVEEKESIAKILIEEESGESKSKLFLKEDFAFDIEKWNLLQLKINRLISGEPLQHVLGYAYFRDFKLKVNSNVLIPRPETEELVEFALKFKSDFKKAIDFCTGSACIAIALQKAKQSAKIRASDWSDKAMQTAQENIDLNCKGEHKPQIIKHDLLGNEYLSKETDFDLIVSNPPYIHVSEAQEMHASVLDFEPTMALFAPETDVLLFYKKLIWQAKRLLVKKGELWAEINPMYVSSLKEFALQEFPEFEHSFLEDMQGKLRFWRAIKS
jgi:release factor glutamine methyltransferase